MEERNMKSEEEMIKRMMAEAFHQEGFDLNLEDKILREVNLSQDKLNEIAVLKRKAKICLGITFGFLATYALVCINMFTSESSDLVQTPSSIVAFNVCLGVGILLVFYQFTYLGNRSENLLKE